MIALAPDKGVDNGDRDKMLSEAKAEYALLKAGDAVVFDMRTVRRNRTTTYVLFDTSFWCSSDSSKR